MIKFGCMIAGRSHDHIKPRPPQRLILWIRWRNWWWISSFTWYIIRLALDEQVLVNNNKNRLANPPAVCAVSVRSRLARLTCCTIQTSSQVGDRIKSDGSMDDQGSLGHKLFLVVEPECGSIGVSICYCSSFNMASVNRTKRLMRP